MGEDCVARDGDRVRQFRHVQGKREGMDMTDRLAELHS